MKRCHSLRVKSGTKTWYTHLLHLKVWNPCLLTDLVSRFEKVTTLDATIDPLAGWTDSEKAALYEHIIDPVHHPPHPDVESWIEA
jgi:hypothetical protein